MFDGGTKTEKNLELQNNNELLQIKKRNSLDKLNLNNSMFSMIFYANTIPNLFWPFFGAMLA